MTGDDPRVLGRVLDPDFMWDAPGGLVYAHEPSHPGNAWLARRFAVKRATYERLEARGLAKQYVLGGLAPRDPSARDRAVQRLLEVRHYADRRQAVNLAVAYMRGWAEHHDTPVRQVWWTNAYHAAHDADAYAWPTYWQAGA
jgi:hypothetical protein